MLLAYKTEKNYNKIILQKKGFMRTSFAAPCVDLVLRAHWVLTAQSARYRLQCSLVQICCYRGGGRKDRLPLRCLDSSRISWNFPMENDQNPKSQKLWSEKICYCKTSVQEAAWYSWEQVPHAGGELRQWDDQLFSSLFLTDDPHVYQNIKTYRDDQLFLLLK